MSLVGSSGRLLRSLGGLIGPGQEAPRQRRRRLEKELEEARRLGHWFTEEDRQLLREHETRLAAEQRADWWRQAGRGGAMALVLLACLHPLVWPLALIGGVKAFPRTSRRLGLSLLGLAALGVISASLGLVLVGRGLVAPPAPLRQALAPGPAPLPSLDRAQPGQPGQLGGAAQPTDGDPADLGRDIAARLSQACDYWSLAGSSADGSATYRKGLYRDWNGETLMVLPRSTWAYLSGRERRALAHHLVQTQAATAIHVGRVLPSSAFAGNTITLEERVWP